MLLEGRNLAFGYDPAHPVIEDFGIALEAGERVGLLGPSGCGKSTLAKILAGYIRPSAGEVRFEGRPLPERGPCPVQLIYQHPEKAVNPRWKMGRTLTEAWTPDARALADMGIETEWLDRYPSELSGGEIQRFCILRAAGPHTRVLIADEISTMLDVVSQAQIWNVLLRLVEQRGLALLLVTHNRHLAEKVCTRCIGMEGVAPFTQPASKRQ
jgi:peptide/nickel transport system ATP-binding protein